MALDKSYQPRMHTDTHGLSKEIVIRPVVGVAWYQVAWYQREGMEYPTSFEPATEGGFVVTFPDFEWGITQGDTEEEAREMAADAIRTMIREHIRNSEELPRPGKARGRKYRMIRLGALDAMKASLYLAFRASGMTKAGLARGLGISKTNVDRLFDLNHRSRLDQIETAFTVLGKRLSVEVRDAA